MSGFTSAKREIFRLDTKAQRAGAADGRCCRGPIIGPWGPHIGGQGFRHFLFHHPARYQGTAKPEKDYRHFADPPPRSRAEES